MPLILPHGRDPPNLTDMAAPRGDGWAHRDPFTAPLTSGQLCGCARRQGDYTSPGGRRPPGLGDPAIQEASGHVRLYLGASSFSMSAASASRSYLWDHPQSLRAAASSMDAGQVLAIASRKSGCGQTSRSNQQRSRGQARTPTQQPKGCQQAAGPSQPASQPVPQPMSAQIISPDHQAASSTRTATRGGGGGASHIVGHVEPWGQLLDSFR